MLRRRTTTTPSDQQPASPDATSQERDAQARPLANGKGRPTPKRRDAERRRRGPVTAPTNRKEASARLREENRRQRMETRQALARGDESKLPPRDRGPVRRFARDYIDGRRRISEFVLPGLVLLYAPLFAGRNSTTAKWAQSAIVAFLLILLAELFLTGLGLRRALAKRFPAGTNTRGAILYGVTRATTLRRLRMPKPQVAIGEPPRP